METDNSTINEIGSRNKEGTPNSIHPIEFTILFTRLNSQFYSPDRIHNSVDPIEFTILSTKLNSQFYPPDKTDNSIHPFEFTILFTR